MLFQEMYRNHYHTDILLKDKEQENKIPQENTNQKELGKAELVAGKIDFNTKGIATDRVLFRNHKTFDSLEIYSNLMLLHTY